MINKKFFLERVRSISVRSAFGGFGIYKMKHVINNIHKYVGQQVVKVITKDENNTWLNIKNVHM